MKLEGQGPTMEDVAAYVQALESLYPVVIIAELQANSDPRRPHFTVQAKAYTKPLEGLPVHVSQRAVSYPSVSHKTFPGALLGAVMDLEQQLQGWAYLTKLPLPLE